MGYSTVQWLACWTYNREVGFPIPPRAEIYLDISAPPLLPSQFSPEYTVHTPTLWVGRTDFEGKYWHTPPPLAEAKKMKPLTFHTQGCYLEISLKVLLFSFSLTQSL